MGRGKKNILPTHRQILARRHIQPGIGAAGRTKRPALSAAAHGPDVLDSPVHGAMDGVADACYNQHRCAEGEGPWSNQTLEEGLD